MPSSDFAFLFHPRTLLEKVLEFRSPDKNDIGWVENSILLFRDWISPILTESDAAVDTGNQVLELARLFNLIVKQSIVAHQDSKNPILTVSCVLG